MTKGLIEANKGILKKIFSEEFWFIVPQYQRPYVWQEENIQELIDDLYYAFENKQNSEYFLGALVLKRTTEKEFREYEILDGQQRLTTLCMMMAVIRDLIKKPQYKYTLSQMIYQEENEILKVPSRNRIKYNTRDKVKDFVKDYIIANGSTRKRDLVNYHEDTNISVSNMAKAISTMHTIFDNKENLEAFAVFLLNNVLFIYVSTDNTEDAFRLFTILNDRGIPLSNADILKSINIGEIGEEDLDEYSKHWEYLEEKYHKGFDRFLSFVRTILLKNKPSSNLLDEYEKNNKMVCMVGDGINDAPALKKSFVGIAMGNVGSDIAVDAADIVLVRDDINNLPHLLKISKRMMKTIKVNLIFSMTLNFVAVILAMTGLLGPVVGALVHNVGSVIVIINSALLLKYNKRNASKEIERNTYLNKNKKLLQYFNEV